MTDASYDTVNIGTPNGGILHFLGNGTTASGGFGIYRTAAQQLQFQGGAGGYVFNNTENSAPVLSISNTGNVGIGISGPTEKLHVSGNVLATGQVTASGGFTNGTVFVGVTGLAGRIAADDFHFVNSGARPGLFSNTGTRLVGNSGCYYAP
jgi:hypothetical protein